MKNSVGKNSIYSLIKSFSQIVFPLITFPYISRTLLAENVGKINFAKSIVGYVGLIASLGITTYAVRECARVREDKEKLENTASQIISMNLILTVIAYICLCVTLILAKPLHDYRLLIGILSLTVVFTTLGADWLNTAMEDFKYVTIRTFLFQLLSLLAMFIFVHKPDDYLKYAVITVLAESGANILNVVYRRKYCRTFFTFKIDWKKHLTPVLLMFAMILSQTIFCSSDITILGIVRGDFEVGLYSTSVKIYNLVNSMIASVAWVVMPQMSYHFAKQNYDEINRLFKFSANFIVVLGLPCVVGINVLCPEIIQVLAGSEFMSAVPSLHILTIALALSLMSGLIGNIVLLPSKREDICLKSCAWAAAINIVTNFIFIPLFGLNAAAATTVVAQLVTLLIGIVHMDKKVKIDNWKEILRAPVIGSVGIIAVVAAVSVTVHQVWLRMALGIILSVIVYVGVLVTLKNRFAREMLQPILSKINRKNNT